MPCFPSYLENWARLSIGSRPSQDKPSFRRRNISGSVKSNLPLRSARSHPSPTVAKSHRCMACLRYRSVRDINRYRNACPALSIVRLYRTPVGDPCARIPNLLWLSSFHYPAPRLNTFGTVMAVRSRTEGKGDGPPDHYRRYGFWFLGI